MVHMETFFSLFRSLPDGPWNPMTMAEQLSSFAETEWDSGQNIKRNGFLVRKLPSNKTDHDIIMISALWFKFICPLTSLLVVSYPALPYLATIKGRIEKAWWVAMWSLCDPDVSKQMCNQGRSKGKGPTSDLALQSNNFKGLNVNLYPKICGT